MKPGDKANPDSFKVRRAKVGGFKDYFDDAQVARLDAMVEERLLPGFGYLAAERAEAAPKAAASA
jgi:alcohol sulfotransferase